MDGPLEGMAGGGLEDDGWQHRFLGRSKLRCRLAPLPMITRENARTRLTIGTQKQ